MTEQMYTIASFVLYDELHFPDGRVVYLAGVHNKIQTTYGVLLAKISSGKDSTAITRMETGSGDPSWDASPPPPDPGTGQTALLNPIVRSAAFVPGTDWVYLNPDFTTSGSATALVQVTATFAIGVSNGTLREVALYGGVAATGTVSTGDLVNVIRHVAISKPTGTGDYSLVRKIRLQY